MTYRIDLSRRAQKQMRDLPGGMRIRVRDRIDELRDDPYRGVAKVAVLGGFRVRVGDYRILFDVSDQQRLVQVRQVLHRREAYR